MRRPSASLIISLLALVFSLSGTAYAVKLIDGKLLEKRSVAGGKLKNNTVGGKQIRESKLGQVPAAKQAETATSAAAANRADAATRADTAGRADTSAQADNANALGGTEASAFVRSFSLERTVQPGGGTVFVGGIAGVAELVAACPGGDPFYIVSSAGGSEVEYVDSASGNGTVPSNTSFLAYSSASSFHARSTQLTRPASNGLVSFVTTARKVGGNCRYRVQGFRS